jgi:tetratricopeptide (TPR) repeat protein
MAINSNNRSHWPAVAGFSAILLAALLPWPRAAAGTNQPWRVELAAAVMLLIVAVVDFMRPRTNGYLAGCTRTIIVALGGFALWSGVSLVWAAYPLPVVHHTLVWAMYLGVFYLALRQSGVWVVTTAFALVALIIGFASAADTLTVTDFSSAEFTIRSRYGKHAELLVTILPVPWLASLYVKERKRKFGLIAAGVLGWTGVMLSLSKGALLAGIIGFLIVFAGCLLLSNKHFRRPVLSLAGLWLGVTVAVQAFFFFASPLPATADYFAGRSGNSALSTQHRMLVWRIAACMSAQRPLTGVGADNFAAFTNIARADVASRDTSPPPTEIAEDAVLERAHNEYLQIFAELGVIGFVLFGAGFGAFKLAIFAEFRRRWRMSPMLWAAIGGMTAFAASSMVSSFSFRAVQNGVAFFLVMAVALSRVRPRKRIQSNSRWPLAAIAVVSFAGLLFFTPKAIGEYHVYRSESAADRTETIASLEQALNVDPDNTNARGALASHLENDGQYERAARELRDAIDRGLGVTLTYAKLANLQRKAGNPAAAERTFTEAVAIFPRSAYLRVEFAVFLDSIGRRADADYMMAAARSIDAKQANGWHALITQGSVAAFYAAQNDTSIAQPSDLVPGNAVRQYLDKIPER